jgi:hypothetical protein
VCELHLLPADIFAVAVSRLLRYEGAKTIFHQIMSHPEIAMTIK